MEKTLKKISEIIQREKEYTNWSELKFVPLEDCFLISTGGYKYKESGWWFLKKMVVVATYDVIATIKYKDL